ncbi:MAG: hypothetical protein LBU70_03470 [Chitinispirillales bacterium]|jgi:nitrate/nitrite-specific signal transduction histidine kinase|nr:hypothetical protein [Chitinispirillales bacterium]
MAKPKPAFVRKHFFIDRSMQISYMVSFLIPMLVMLGFMLFTFDWASKTIITTSSDIMWREVTNVVTVETLDTEPPYSVEQYDRIINQIQAKVRNFSNIGDVRDELAGTLMKIFGVGILLVVLQVALMTIYFSHKFAGPVYRFEKSCLSVISGKYDDMIRLRKGDQMLNLATLLNESMKVSGERIAALEAKIVELGGTVDSGKAEEETVS